MRDLLLRSAEVDLVRVHWSQDVLDEVSGTLVNDIRIQKHSVRRLLETMRRAFPEAEVIGYRSLVDSLEVMPEDRHVLAGAIVSRCDVLLTRNVRHFPPDAVAPYGIIVMTPDQVLLELFDTLPQELLKVVESRARDLGDSVPETLGFLRRHVPGFVQKIEAHSDP